jgi:hypothetical protein
MALAHIEAVQTTAVRPVSEIPCWYPTCEFLDRVGGERAVVVVDVERRDISVVEVENSGGQPSDRVLKEPK